MANVINATSTGNGGLVSTGDDSGILNIQTNETTAITVDASQRVAFVAGTAALPAITTTGDTNTGIFFPAADTIAFSEGGAEAMRIDSSGNVGIGTSSPSTKLAVAGGISGTGAINISGGGWGTLPYVANSLVIDNNAGESRFFATGADASTDGSFLFYTSQTDGGTNERMRVPSDGGIRVAMQNYASAPSSTNYGVSINNTGSGSRFFGQGSGTETQIEFGNTNGTRGSIQTNATNTLYNTTSDYRLKENVVPMANALATVLALKPCTYKWKVDGSDGQGFIAHELQAVVPDCVTGEKDAVDENGDIKPQFVDTSFLVATLTAALQETKALLDTQAETINALTARIVALESK